MVTAVRTGPLYPRAGFYFLMMLLVAFAAFYPSYFSQLSRTDAVRHFHGVVATAWIALLATQGLLMWRRQVALHRRLGRLAYVIAPLFVISGLLIIQDMARGANPFQQAFGARLAFVDLLATGMFAASVWLAIRDRRQVQRHARWMACTALLLLPPAVGRLAPLLPFVRSFDMAFHVAFLVTEAIVLCLLLDDRGLGQRLPPYRVLLAVTLLQHAGFALVDGWPAWGSLMRWVGGLA